MPRGRCSRRCPAGLSLQGVPGMSAMPVQHVSLYDRRPRLAVQHAQRPLPFTLDSPAPEPTCNNTAIQLLVRAVHRVQMQPRKWANRGEISQSEREPNPDPPWSLFYFAPVFTPVCIRLMRGRCGPGAAEPTWSPHAIGVAGHRNLLELMEALWCMEPRAHNISEDMGPREPMGLPWRGLV